MPEAKLPPLQHPNPKKVRTPKRAQTGKMLRPKLNHPPATEVDVVELQSSLPTKMRTKTKKRRLKKKKRVTIQTKVVAIAIRINL